MMKPNSDPLCQQENGKNTAECFVPGCGYWELLLRHKVGEEERSVRVSHLGKCARNHTDTAA